MSRENIKYVVMERQYIKDKIFFFFFKKLLKAKKVWLLL